MTDSRPLPQQKNWGALAREAYKAHRNELRRVSPDYDPGPWDDLSAHMRGVWVQAVKDREAKAA